ncbi:MAG: LytTR family transcriptional regulator [Eubacterium sp.]|nr:LytTR family transcriptional regulator [Eubacterium sp.]
MENTSLGNMRPEYLPFVSKRMSGMIEIGSIEQIIQKGRQIVIIVGNDENEYVFTGNIDELAAYLDERFCRSVRCCMVNLSRIKSMKDNCVEFFGGRKLYLGRDNFIKLKQRYNAYLNGLLSVPGTDLHAIPRG